MQSKLAERSTNPGIAQFGNAVFKLSAYEPASFEVV
jgi:hypothetical protein